MTQVPGAHWLQVAVPVSQLAAFFNVNDPKVDSGEHKPETMIWRTPDGTPLILPLGIEKDVDLGDGKTGAVAHLMVWQQEQQGRVLLARPGLPNPTRNGH